MSTAEAKQSKQEKETPLMKQYNAIKAKYPGALLLFRVGDFYETFGEDAVKAAKILSITLTKRANGSASEIALAGFPHHSLDSYLPKLIRAGQRVAICDQLENPKDAIGIVKRGVTEMVTPGVHFSDSTLEARSANYLCAIHLHGPLVGLAFLDATTGEFCCAQGDEAYAAKLLQSLSPAEVIGPRSQMHLLEDKFGPLAAPFFPDDWVFGHEYASENLRRHFDVAGLKGFGVEDMPAAVAAAGAALHYLAETEHRQLSHIASLSRLDEDGILWLDRFTVRNLEILECQQAGGTPLVAVLDKTASPMGARLLRRWLCMALTDLRRISERHECVAWLVENQEEAEALSGHLKLMGDLERLGGKVALGRVSPREMQQLSRALKQLGPMRELLSTSRVHPLTRLADQLSPCQGLCDRITMMLADELPAQASQGGIIREGIDAELDELRRLAFSGKDYLLDLQRREAARTGISSLKISYNRVFGYYLEVTHAHRDKVPQDWIRKQTLVNAERYITPELKEYEEKILHAEEHIGRIEQRLWMDLLAEALTYVESLQLNARAAAEADCLLSFACCARDFGYVRPVMDPDRGLSITEGRHPVIERQLPPGEDYVPNDVHLDAETQQIIVITGPNMSGKSALLRQTALIVLMAQAGSFVPAKKAHIGLVDKIFTRVGASDNLSRGESTFMVEMTETASILNNLSDRSLVLMDEIGRGTSTYDGISIAWAIVEFLHNHERCRPKTLFATHYHELNELATGLERVRNFNVAVREADGRVIFLRKLIPGGSEHSFGIHVAQMAGIPVEVVARAAEVLTHLEKEKTGGHNFVQRLKKVPKPMQLSLFGGNNPQAELIFKALENLDINALSPIQALLKLAELKQMGKG
jgi:DNA mismatch repair protein MutS